MDKAIGNTTKGSLAKVTTNISFTKHYTIGNCTTLNYNFPITLRDRHLRATSKSRSIFNSSHCLELGISRDNHVTLTCLMADEILAKKRCL